MRPFSVSLAWVAKRVLRTFGLRPDAVSVTLSRRELQVIFEDMTQGEGLTEEEGEIASNIFSFSETRAEEIMTPRVDVLAISVDQAVESLKEAVIACHHARIPVYRGSLDQIVGIVNAKDVLLEPGQPLDHFLRPVPFIPERARLSTILNEVKARRLSFFVVVNEYGGTAGILTKEDLVEEIVGEIFDEQERDEEPEIRQLAEKTWRVNGLLGLDDLGEEVDIRLQSPAQTVAGHVAHLLGRPPRQGDVTEDLGVEFKVLSVKRHRASQVQVRVL
jgi:putative hemolysin